MAWLSPSCHAVHRRLRIPDLRKGSDSPLRTKPSLCHQRTSPSRRLSTPRIPRSDLSVTSQARSRLSASSSPAPSPVQSKDSHVANAKHTASSCDTVRLGSLLNQRLGLMVRLLH